MAQCPAQHGVKVAILSLNAETSEKVAGMIKAAGGQAVGVACDVLDRDALEGTRALVTDTYGPIDILINAAGGNHPNATISKDVPFFDLDVHAISDVFSTNFTGTFQCCQVFGRDMAEQGHGCIVNITSMSALRPLTRIPAYSAAKATVANFTQWLAVHIAQDYHPAIRLNAHLLI